MGLVGSLILVIVPAALSDRHGESQAVALSEANVIASLFSPIAPLLVGGFARSFGIWRFALSIMAFAPLLMYIGLGKDDAPIPVTGPAEPARPRRLLSSLFWMYWSAIVLAVSAEFCMVFWSADYLEQALGLGKASAAQAVSLFLAAMILGRLAGSRLVQRFSIRRVLTISFVAFPGHQCCGGEHHPGRGACYPGFRHSDPGPALGLGETRRCGWHPPGLQCSFDPAHQCVFDRSGC